MPGAARPRPRPSKGDGDGWVVLFRAVNVGGHQVFSPATLAKELSEWGAKNFGAAGTMALSLGSSEKAVRQAITADLPITPEMVVLTGREFRLALDLAPPQVAAPKDGAQGFASVLLGPPKHRPLLPLVFPSPTKWQLRLVGTQGPFVFSARRALEPGAFYPNEFVEKAYGAPATTRGWPTLKAVRQHLDSLAPS